MQTEPSIDEPDAGLAPPRRRLAIAAVLIGVVLVVLDAAITSVALPSIAAALGVSASLSVWVVTAYQLALVMALLPSAALGESIGYRRVFGLGVALFTTASVLCALSPSLPWLIGARFVQGLGGAALMALGVALLRFVVPHRLLGAVIGWNALAVALASAAGPTIGAAILSVAGWPWLFAINLPIGLVVLLASRALPVVAGTARRLDVVSIGLNAAAFAAVVIGADQLPRHPALSLALFAAGAAGFTALIRRELPLAAPLVPLDLLRAASFRISVIASVCCFAGQTAAMVAVPFYLQYGLGQCPLMTGLLMTPWPLAVALAAPAAGRLANRVSTATLCAAGGAILAIGLAATAIWPLHGNVLALVPLMVLSGVGFGLFQVPNNRNMLLAAPRARSGAAGGMQGTARLTGQTIGAVLMTLLLGVAPADTGPRIGLAIGAGLALAGGLVSMLRMGAVSRQLLTQ